MHRLIKAVGIGQRHEEFSQSACWKDNLNLCASLFPLMLQQRTKGTHSLFYVPTPSLTNPLLVVELWFIGLFNHLCHLKFPKNDSAAVRALLAKFISHQPHVK